MKLLLIMPHPNPKKSFFSRFQYPCLTLQQIAGITPPEHEVIIVDERYENIRFNDRYDLVGISCLTYNSLRGYEVAKIFRGKEILKDYLLVGLINYLYAYQSFLLRRDNRPLCRGYFLTQPYFYDTISAEIG